MQPMSVEVESGEKRGCSMRPFLVAAVAVIWFGAISLLWAVDPIVTEQNDVVGARFAHSALCVNQMARRVEDWSPKHVMMWTHCVGAPVSTYEKSWMALHLTGKQLLQLSDSDIDTKLHVDNLDDKQMIMTEIKRLRMSGHRHEPPKTTTGAGVPLTKKQIQEEHRKLVPEDFEEVLLELKDLNNAMAAVQAKGEVSKKDAEVLKQMQSEELVMRARLDKLMLELSHATEKPKTAPVGNNHAVGDHANSDPSQGHPDAQEFRSFEGEQKVLSCPQPADVTSECDKPTLMILSAHFGLVGCGTFDTTSQVHSVCDGLQSCSAKWDTGRLMIEDPCPGMRKMMMIKYKCQLARPINIYTHVHEAMGMDEMYLDGHDLILKGVRTRKPMFKWHSTDPWSLHTSPGKHMLALHITAPSEGQAGLFVLITAPKCDGSGEDILFRTGDPQYDETARVNNGTAFEGLDRVRWRYASFDDDREQWRQSTLDTGSTFFETEWFKPYSLGVGRGVKWVWPKKQPWTTYPDSFWFRFPFEVSPPKGQIMPEKTDSAAEIDKMLQEREWGTYDVVTPPEFSDPPPLLIHGVTYYPASFCMPDQKIVTERPQKKTSFAALLPGSKFTYRVNSEAEMYKQYQEARFCVTHKKYGWDCMRHYEIMSQGCIPLFIDIESSPEFTMWSLPKKTLKEIMGLRGLHTSLRPHVSPPPWYMPCCDLPPDAADNLPQSTDKYFMLDPSEFNETYYDELLDSMLDYTRKHLSCSALIQYAMRVTNNTNAKKFLFLSTGQYSDYMRDLVLIGLRTLSEQHAEVTVVDEEKICHVYKSCPHPGTYGRGWSYSQVVQDAVVDRSHSSIKQKIANHEFDVIVYGCIYREMPFWKEVVAAKYPVENVWMWHGGDSGGSCDQAKGVGTVFLREINFGLSNMRSNK